MDPVTGLFKTASDLTVRIREILGAREGKLDEVVARIIELQGLISDGRTALIDAQEQLLEKNRTILALEQDNSEAPGAALNEATGERPRQRRVEGSR